MSDDKVIDVGEQFTLYLNTEGKPVQAIERRTATAVDLFTGDDDCALMRSPEEGCRGTGQPVTPPFNPRADARIGIMLSGRNYF
jgi:hypothetical protein